MLLQHEDISLVANKDCSFKHYIQTFFREKIEVLHECMYVMTTFQFQCHMKLDVHQQTCMYSDGQKVVTIEGVNVYHKAWKHIMALPESTFYRYAKHASKNIIA